jgi:catalase
MKLFTALAVSSLLIQSCFSQNNSGGNNNDPVQAAIVNDAGTQETTQFGAKINNTDSLQAGERGPTLLEDFMVREKIMHFGKLPVRFILTCGV